MAITGKGRNGLRTSSHQNTALASDTTRILLDTVGLYL